MEHLEHGPIRASASNAVFGWTVNQAKSQRIGWIHGKSQNEQATDKNLHSFDAPVSYSLFLSRLLP